MKIFQYSLGELQANCYFVVDEEDNCLIIDPADEGGFLVEESTRKKLNVLAMLATHGHFDHLMAAFEIQKVFSCPLYLDKKDLFLFKRMKESAKYFLSYKPYFLPPKKIKFFENKKIKISNFSFDILSCPGHTPGSLSFYFKKEKVLFTGDTLFKEGIGRYDFSYSSKRDLFHSLKKIINLKDDIVIYPGHGEKTTLDEAREFLKNHFF